MERGEVSQPYGPVKGSQGQDNLEHDSSSNGRHSDESTVPSVSKATTEQSQTQTGWIKKLKVFFHEPVKPNERHDLIVIDRLEDHPQGYPRLASYINSDANFANYRRFGYLRNRALLQRQDELCVLQERLETLDDEDKEKEPLNLQSRERDEKYNSTRRRELIYEIEAKLNVYDNLLFREAKLRSLHSPSNRNHNSLWNWIESNRPLVESEEQFVYSKNDFVSVGGAKVNARADDAFEWILDKFYNWQVVKYMFSSEDQREISQHPLDHYYSKPRIQFVTRTVGTFCVLAAVIIPVYFLFGTESSTLVKLLIVLGCTMIFPLIVETFTRIDRQQVFALMVAYCAVLVVFLGNLQGVVCGQGTPGSQR